MIKFVAFTILIAVLCGVTTAFLTLNLDLPKVNLDLLDGNLDLPEGHLDLPEGNLDLPEWHFYKQIHKKNFESIKNEQECMETFMNHLQKIKAHNDLYKQGKVSFRRSVNKFTDMKQKDFAARMHGFISGLVEPNTAQKGNRAMLFRSIVPKSIDWTKRGYNTPVKDQETCASCWSFAAAGAIEAHEKIRNGRTLDLSEQNLVDCAPSNYNVGCMGGHPLYAYNYTMANQGLSLRMYYPYENEKGNCRYKKVFNSGTYSVSYKRLPKGDEEALMEAVAFIGPITSAIDGTLDSLRDYSGGIYYDEECSSDNITHAVLIVGYGTENGQDYWLIKNSLGKYWGEKGYMKLARNKNNHCGIATDASYPIIQNSPNKRF